MELLFIIGVFVIVILIYFIYINFCHPWVDIVHFKDIKHRLRTGDLILFHALNNYYAPLIGSYYTHIGIVYMKYEPTEADPYNKEPYIFEAAATNFMPFHEKNALVEHQNGKCNGKGIMFSRLDERLRRYKGYVFYKPLLEHIEVSMKDELKFEQFMDECMDKYSYNYTPLRHSLGKYFRGESCGPETNCGEIVFLSLIEMGILKLEEKNNVRLHYLRYVCNLGEDVGYGGPVYIMDDPF